MLEFENRIGSRVRIHSGCLVEYPSPRPEDVKAAIAYAADLARERLEFRRVFNEAYVWTCRCL